MTKRSHRLIGLALLGMLVLATLALAGCSSERVVARAGEHTCVQCHTNRSLLKADLKADPKPVKEKAKSEGEG